MPPCWKRTVGLTLASKDAAALYAAPYTHFERPGRVIRVRRRHHQLENHEARGVRRLRAFHANRHHDAALVARTRCGRWAKHGRVSSPRRTERLEFRIGRASLDETMRAIACRELEKASRVLLCAL
jgi:hypothetical protein